MRLFNTTLLILSFTLFYSCSLQTSNGKVTQFSNFSGNEVNQKRDKSKFKYEHIRSFYPGIFKGEKLIKIDSVYHSKVISQIEGYNMPYTKKMEGNYFISKQNKIHNYEAHVVSLYWGACYHGIHLLILDKESKLINNLQLTEWYSSCDISTDTKTEFLNDTTFIKEQTTTEPGETNHITKVKFKAFITQKGQIDTLKVLEKKEYDE